MERVRGKGAAAALRHQLSTKEAALQLTRGHRLGARTLGRHGAIARLDGRPGPVPFGLRVSL